MLQLMMSHPGMYEQHSVVLKTERMELGGKIRGGSQRQTRDKGMGVDLIRTHNKNVEDSQTEFLS